MLLAIDVGNTNTVFAVFDGEDMKGQWRAATDVQRTADEHAVWFSQLMAPTLVASRVNELKRFAADHGEVVLKPLGG